MRKTIATIVILGLVWIGYTAWPIYDLLVLARAMETRDVHTVTQHVYFDAVRVSLTESSHRCLHSVDRSQDQSARAKYGRCLGDRRSITAVPDPPPGTVGITESTIGTIWQIFGNSEYGLARFEVTAPSTLPHQQRFRLTFRLFQWRWRLVAVTLPENIQKLLGDELAKALRTPVQNQ